MTPEQKARVSIDALLVQAGWHICNVANANIHAAVGVAIREFPLNTDFLMYVNCKACGAMGVKKVGATSSGVEVQSGCYVHGLPEKIRIFQMLARANLHRRRSWLPPMLRELESDTNQKRAQALKHTTLPKAFVAN